MKKSKIILFTIVIILVCCLSAVCVACAKKHTHIWDTNWSCDNENHFKKCVECDEKTELAEHRFNEGECDICGYIAEASHLDFELSEDGSYYIVVGEGNYTVKNLHIPSIHNDKAVKKIGASAFERNKIVRNIVLPDSIVEIGQNAFQFNEVLKSIAIPQSVQKIGAGAFSGCLNMNKVNIQFSY